MTKKRLFRPGKFSLANANAASVQVISCPIVTITAISTLLA